MTATPERIAEIRTEYYGVGHRDTMMDIPPHPVDEVIRDLLSALDAANARAEAAEKLRDILNIRMPLAATTDNGGRIVYFLHEEVEIIRTFLKGYTP